jgi:FkbM family methyltransferase
MKQALSRAFKNTIAHTIGRDRVGRLLAMCARRAGVSLLDAAYNDMGILRYEDFDVSGERYFLERYVQPRYNGASSPIMFDVGANIGDYARLLVRSIPQARVFSFEPNPDTFKVLSSNLADTSVRCVNQGMSSVAEKRSLFLYPDQPTSPHATVNRDLLAEFHKCAVPKEISCSFTTVDEFCKQQNIPNIDLLKIDAEGHELEVVKGAHNMIAEKKVTWIHFEFGEGNVFSRVFLKDYYDTLPGYEFFRVTSKGLVPLGNYGPRHEIFLFQNIVAAPVNQVKDV